jgi:hypothetical protein
MQIDTGTIIAVGAAVLFYLRLIVIQRQRVKEFKQSQSQVGKNKQNRQIQPGETQRLSFRIRSRVMLWVGVSLIVIGALLSAIPVVPPGIREYWWLPFTFGIVILGVSVY